MSMIRFANKLRWRPNHSWPRARLGLSTALMLGLAALSAVLLLGWAGPAQGQPTNIAETPDSALRTDRPLKLPDSLRHPVNLRRGIQFGIGTHNITVTSEALQTELPKKSSFSDGGSLHVDWLLDSFRLSYLRQQYRPELESNIPYEGKTLARVAFDSDQIWAYHGWRPWYPLYLGYGLGFLRREVSLTADDDTKKEFSESLAMAGLLLDYAFAAPVSIQIRMVWEEDGGFFQVSGNTVFLSYSVPL